MRLPKYFQPVGVSNSARLFFAATRSTAPLVGMLRATAWEKEEKDGKKPSYYCTK